jgi:ParB-like chromosome segregation protein Spo0J
VKTQFPTYKTVKTDSLIPYARNSRTHSEQQISKIAASIKEFGFLNPVIIDGANGIVAGHGRVMAAQKLGLLELPVIEASHLTDAQRRAYVIADNRLALDAGWDEEMLRVEFAELTEAGFDLDLTGFSLDEIGALGFDNDSALDQMPLLPDGDKEPYQQKTFILHDEQAAVVDDAVTLARTNPLSDTGINENSNGNALALICEQWLEARNG